MTTRPFRFRYTSEMAGAFVIFSVALLVAGVIVAGHAQGWFERKIILKARFESEEGAFGLQEGDEVRIRNALAGRVGKIMPMRDGSIETVFIIKKRFMTFVTKDSVAMVRKKFGVAGDSFVDLERGKGAQALDGDLIVCRKDEEIMEIARRTLNDVQSVLLPLLDESKQILEHINGIVGSVEKGDGLAGTLLKDKGLADEFKKAVDNVNFLLQDTQETMAETTRLVKGAQKHWLFRRYVEEDKSRGYVAARRFNDIELRRYGGRFQSALDKARIANNAGEISRNAYNLAVCLLSESRYDEIRTLLAEADAESHGQGDNGFRHRLLEAEVCRRTGETNRALEIVGEVVGSLGRSASNDTRLECRLMLASLNCEIGRIDESKSELKAMSSLIRKTESERLKALAARVTGQALLAEGRFAEAGAQFDSEAAWLQEADCFYEMAGALETAGRVYEQGGNAAAAADRYFRAGRSWQSGGYGEAARRALAEACAPAQVSSNAFIIAQGASLTNRTLRPVAPPAPVAP